MDLFSSTISQLETGLQAATMKQKAHAANIANVDTPNYKAARVSFQAELDQKMSFAPLQSYKTNAKHLSFTGESSTPGIRTHTLSTTQRQPNGNNVDMDLEMSELAKNQLWYNAMTERISGKFNSLRSVINEGK